jgi:hypothetical protein
MTTIVTKEQQEFHRRIAAGEMTKEEYYEQNRKSFGMGIPDKTEAEIAAGWARYQAEAGNPSLIKQPGKFVTPKSLEEGLIPIFQGYQPIRQQSIPGKNIADMPVSTVDPNRKLELNMDIGSMLEKWRGEQGLQPLSVGPQPMSIEERMRGFNVDGGVGFPRLDVRTAKDIFFGDKKIDPIEEAEFRTTIETGDTKIDPKRVRKFTNYDGSLTWELLNEDKTVMNRFTMGEYAGKKIYAQGGYQKFADLLKTVQQQTSPDDDAKEDFDAITQSIGER